MPPETFSERSLRIQNKILEGKTIAPEDRPPFAAGPGYLDLPRTQEEHNRIRNHSRIISPHSQRDGRTINRTQFDLWAGPWITGLAKTGELLTGIPAHIVPGKGWVEESHEAMGDFIERHPEWQPEEIESWWNLFDNPYSLYAGVSQIIPQTAAIIGSVWAASAAAPFIGLGAIGAKVLAAATGFFVASGMESQGAYDRLLAEGASHERALGLGVITGGASGLLELAQATRLLNIGRKVRNANRAALVRGAAMRGDRMTRGMQAGAISKELLFQMGAEGMIEMLQGTVGDALAYGFTPGNEIREAGVGGFVDRRMQEFIIAGTTGGLFGLSALSPGSEVNSLVKATNQVASASQEDRMRVLLKVFMQEDLGLDSDQVSMAEALFDTDLEVFSERLGISRSDFAKAIFSPHDEISTEGVPTANRESAHAPSSFRTYAKDAGILSGSFREDNLSSFVSSVLPTFLSRLAGSDVEVAQVALGLEPGQSPQTADLRQSAELLTEFLETGASPGSAQFDFSEMFKVWSRRLYQRVKRDGEIRLPESLDTSLDIHLASDSREIQVQRLIVEGLQKELEALTQEGTKIGQQKVPAKVKSTVQQKEDVEVGKVVGPPLIPSFAGQEVLNREVTRVPEAPTPVAEEAPTTTEVERPKASGYGPDSTMFNTPALQGNTTYAWRSMGAKEFENLTAGKKIYSGDRAATKGNWLAGNPESASEHGVKKGKYLVEFGNINIQGGEGLSPGSTANRDNISRVWKYDGEKWVDESQVLETLEKGVSEAAKKPTQRKGKPPLSIDDIIFGLPAPAAEKPFSSFGPQEGRLLARLEDMFPKESQGLIEWTAGGVLQGVQFPSRAYVSVDNAPKLINLLEAKKESLPDVSLIVQRLRDNISETEGFVEGDVISARKGERADPQHSRRIAQALSEGKTALLFRGEREIDSRVPIGKPLFFTDDYVYASSFNTQEDAPVSEVLIKPSNPIVGETRDDIIDALFGSDRPEPLKTPAISHEIPDVVYRGASKPKIRAANEGGSLGNGYYMTPDKKRARTYGSHVVEGRPRIKNPLVIDMPTSGRGWDNDPAYLLLVKLGVNEDKAAKITEKAYDEKGYITNEVRNRARKQGYDGIVQKRGGEVQEIVAFNKEQMADMGLPPQEGAPRYNRIVIAEALKQIEAANAQWNMVDTPPPVITKEQAQALGDLLHPNDVIEASPSVIEAHGGIAADGTLVIRKPFEFVERLITEEAKKKGHDVIVQETTQFDKHLEVIVLEDSAYVSTGSVIGSPGFLNINEIEKLDGPSVLNLASESGVLDGDIQDLISRLYADWEGVNTDLDFIEKWHAIYTRVGREKGPGAVTQPGLTLREIITRVVENPADRMLRAYRRQEERRTIASRRETIDFGVKGLESRVRLAYDIDEEVILHTRDSSTYESLTENLGPMVRVMERLGREVVFYEGDAHTKLSGLAGFSLTTEPNVVFVNVDSKAPALEVASHELLHSIIKLNPRLYQRLLTTVVNYKPELIEAGIGRYLSALGGSVEARKYFEEASDPMARLVEEGMGMVLEETMSTKDFWIHMKTHNRSLYDIMVDMWNSLIDSFNSVILRVGGSWVKGDRGDLEPGLRHQEFISDLAGMVSELVDSPRELILKPQQLMETGPGFEGQPTQIRGENQPLALPARSKGVPDWNPGDVVGPEQLGTIEDLVPYEIKTDEIKTEETGEYKNLEAQLDSAKKGLDEARRSRIDIELSADLRISEGEITVESLLSQESDKQVRARGDLRHAWDTASSIVSQIMPLRSTKGGRMFEKGLNIYFARLRKMEGEMENIIVDLNKALGGGLSANKKWLQDIGHEEGNYAFTNARLMTDADSPVNVEPLNEKVEDYRNLVWKINEYMGGRAQRAKVIQEMRAGSRIFAQAKDPRMPRLYSTRAQQAMMDARGMEYEAIIDALYEANKDVMPGLKSKDAVRREISKNLKDPKKRRAGLLQNVRVFKVVPDLVKMSNGKWFSLLRTAPYDVLSKSVSLQASRIAWVEVFGQGEIIGLEDKKAKSLLKQFTKILNIEPKADKALLLSRLRDAGVFDEGMEKLSVKELRKIIAQENRIIDEATDVKTADYIHGGVTLDDYRDAVDEVTHLQLDPKQERELREFVNQELKGIQTSGTDLKEVFALTRERLFNPTIDIVERLSNMHKQEGGDLTHFENITRLALGLPYHWMDRDIISRTVQLGSTVIGSAQTSLSTMVNIPQTIMQVPRYVGFGKYMQAVVESLSDYRMTRAQMAGMGGFSRVVKEFSFEHGHRLEGIGRMIRHGVGAITGLNFIAELNNVISARAFNLMAMDWDASGMSRGDIRLARELRLTEDEIRAVRDHQITDEIMAKVVQNGTGMTQFVAENPTHKGLLENWPLMKILFSYNSYALGTTRANVRLLKEGWDIVKNYDKAAGPIPSLSANNIADTVSYIKRLTVFLMGTAGAGFTSVILREMMKGRIPDRDELEDRSLWDRALAGLVEVQLFGAAQRILDPFKFASGDTSQLLVGLSPQMKATADLLGALVGGFGIKGKFPLGERLSDTAQRHTPAVKGVITWLDKIAYPELDAYGAARIRSNKWKKDKAELLGETTGIGSYQIEPKYYPVREMVKRFDVKGARQAASEYYIDALKRGKTLDEASRRLRASLMSSRPVPLSRDEAILFYLSLPPKKAADFMITNRAYSIIIDQITN